MSAEDPMEPFDFLYRCPHCGAVTTVVEEVGDADKVFDAASARRLTFSEEHKRCAPWWRRALGIPYQPEFLVRDGAL